jgi:hypothetical protein
MATDTAERLEWTEDFPGHYTARYRNREWALHRGQDYWHLYEDRVNTGVSAPTLEAMQAMARYFIAGEADEASCAAVCADCRAGVPLNHSEDGWWHGRAADYLGVFIHTGPCLAAAFRNRMREVKGGD